MNGMRVYNFWHEAFKIMQNILIDEFINFDNITPNLYICILSLADVSNYFINKYWKS